jgi:hypothetical protein
MVVEATCGNKIWDLVKDIRGEAEFSLGHDSVMLWAGDRFSLLVFRPKLLFFCLAVSPRKHAV